MTAPNIALPTHVTRHAPGGPDDMFGGVRQVPLPLTMSAGVSGLTDTATAVHGRLPMKPFARSRRWRIHGRNHDDRTGTAFTGGVSFNGFWAGPHALDAYGAMTGKFTGTPTRVADAFTSDAAGGEFVTPWNVSDALQQSRGREYLLSFGYTCAAQNNHLGYGGGWRSAFPADASIADPPNALTPAQAMPFDLWIEYEISAQVSVLAHICDSLGVGTKTDWPVRDAYPSKHGHIHGVWPMILANHGSQMSDWTDTSQWKWQKYAGLSKPDAILSELGSNDIMAGAGQSLATSQARFGSLVQAIRSFWGPQPLYARTILPRNGSSTDATRDTVRRNYNAWLYTLPNSLVAIIPFDEVVVDPTTSNPQQLLSQYVDVDNTHLNSAGQARTAVAIPGPLVQTHVRPAPALIAADTSVPGPVTALTATAVAGGVTVAWTNPGDANFGGTVVRRLAGSQPPTSPVQPGSQLTSTGQGVSSIVDTAAAPNTTYSYSVFTRNRSGLVSNTPVSKTVVTAADNTPPGPVTGLTAVPDQTAVRLAWSNPTDSDFAGVAIRRAVGATPPPTATSGTAVTTTQPTDTSFSDGGVSANTQYSYSLFALDGAGNPAVVATATVTTLAAITGLATAYSRRFAAKAISGSAGASVASWPDSAGSGTALATGTAAGTIVSATAPVLADESTGLTGGATTRVVEFNGSTDELGQLIARAQPHTVAIAFRFKAAPAQPSVMIVGSSSTAGARGSLFYASTSGNLAMNAGATLPASPAKTADTGWHLMIAAFNGTSSVLHIDGVEVTGDAGTEAADRLLFGGWVNSGWYSRIQIAENLLFPAALSSADRASLRTQLKAAYPALP